MGLRFRRRFHILPGVTFNLSRSGVSTSLGVRGAHLTLGHGHVRQTVGLPGTGISYTTISKQYKPRTALQVQRAWSSAILMTLFLLIFALMLR